MDFLCVGRKREPKLEPNSCRDCREGSQNILSQSHKNGAGSPIAALSICETGLDSAADTTAEAATTARFSLGFESTLESNCGMADVGGASSAAAAAPDTLLQKWRCDVCKVRFFADFDEACAHEVECQKAMDALTAKQTTTATPVAAATATATARAPLVTQDTLEPKKESKAATTAVATTKSNNDSTTKPPSPIITPTKPSPKSSRSDSTNTNSSHSKSSHSKSSHLSQSRIDRKRKTTTSNPNGNASNNVNTSTSSNTVIPLVQAIKEAMSQQIKPMKESTLTEETIGQLRDLLSKLESLEITLEVLQTTLIGTVVCKFKKHPILGPSAKALVQNWKAIAAKAQKAQQKAQTQAKQAAKAVGKPKAPAPPPKQKQKQATTATKPHSFFNPRSNKSKSSSKSSTNVPINPFFAPRKKAASPADAVLEETRNLKRKLPCSSSNTKEDNNSDESVRLSPETTKVMAAIFQNKSTKQIIAEQRKAELAANREAERKREKERAAKRAANFGGKAHHSTKATSQGNSNHARLLPVAPRFPVPNHVGIEVGRNTTSQEDLCDAAILPQDHPLRSSPSSTAVATTATASKSWLSSPSALDTADVNATTFTAIQRALFDTFSILPPPSQDRAASFSNNQTFWKDRMKLEKDSIVGSQPQQVFWQLAECIDHWRVARNESLERAAERHRKLARGRHPNKKKVKKKPRRAYDYYEDDDWLVGDDEMDPADPSSMAPLCLLVGPPASGKTAMVHAVAKHCGNCKVLEINTSRARSGAALKHAIEEATQSNSSLEMLQNKTNTMDHPPSNFFGAAKKKRVLEDSDEEEEGPPDKKKSSVTIVLIDEVDILFEAQGDAGFWTALGGLAKATKCPIVLTANACPPQLEGHSHSSRGGGLVSVCKRFWLERPLAQDCASYLWGICRSRESGLQLQPELQARGAQAIQEQLTKIAQSCECDLRKLLQELQVFCALAQAKPAPPTGGWKAKIASSTDAEFEEMKSPLARQDSRHDEIPTIVSLEPSRIPMNQHSVVVAKGTNFGSFCGQDTNVRIQMGSLTIAKWHVVDDNTLLLWYPPYEASKLDAEWVTNPRGRWRKRILPLSIECGTNTSPSRMLISESLANGTNLTGTYRPTIEYVLPEEDCSRAAINGDEEAEFESNPETKDENTLPLNNPSSPDEPDSGLGAWEAAIANSQTNSTKSNATITKEPKPTMPRDDAMASDLDFLAKRAHDLSDAAFLEEFGDGLPYLSGASRGFAYDHTEDGCASYQTGADTLKMHEKSKPPREEKLFALGWKDNCCFYGNSETYMTLPSLSQRKEAKTMMNHFRGDEDASGQLACGSTNGAGSASSTAVAALSAHDLEANSLMFREDLDALVHHHDSSGACSASREEDSYLPRGVPQIVLDLPEMLRARSVSAQTTDSSKDEEHKVVWNSLEARRSETLTKLVEHTTEYILPPLYSSSSSSWQQKNDRSRWSYGRLGLETNLADRNRLILECLPVLRRIGILERCAEFLHEQQEAAAARDGADTSQSSSLRRSTRRVTRAAPKPRHQHYFDKISATLRRDEADLETSAVGALFADQWQSGLVRPFHRKGRMRKEP